MQSDTEDIEYCIKVKWLIRLLVVHNIFETRPHFTEGNVLHSLTFKF